MNGNSSKQVLLSVLGIAVLVVAVVGVSFAFFTYSRNGTENNTLTTGSIIFNYTEGTGIKLTNQFPVTDEVGANINAASGDNAVLPFELITTNTSSKAISYEVKVYAGTVPSSTSEGVSEGTDQTKNRFYDNEIKIKLTGHQGAALDGITSGFKTGAVVAANSNNTASKAGVTIATGSLSGTTSQKFELRMWIPSSVVSIGNTTNRSSHAYSSSDFANMFYSLRVDVTASATA